MHQFWFISFQYMPYRPTGTGPTTTENVMSWARGRLLSEKNHRPI